MRKRCRLVIKGTHPPATNFQQVSLVRRPDSLRSFAALVVYGPRCCWLQIDSLIVATRLDRSFLQRLVLLYLVCFSQITFDGLAQAYLPHSGERK